jgi:phage tail-like protein
VAEIQVPLGFHFLVEFQGIGDQRDTLFQGVSGLESKFSTESYREGGQNHFQHTLPSLTEYSNLILKRGFLKDSSLIKWCEDAFQLLAIEPKNIVIKLLNRDHKPLVTWNVVNAWPLSWSISEFDAQQSTLVIETLELHYDYFTIIR